MTARALAHADTRIYLEFEVRRVALTNVLERIVSGRTKNNQLRELLVWNWKAAREAERAAA